MARGVEVQVELPSVGPLLDRLAGAGVEVNVASRAWPWWVCPEPVSVAERVRRAVELLHASRGPVGHLRATIRRIRPDVVVTNTFAFPHGAVAARCESVPHVWSVHELGREGHGLRNLLGDGNGLRVIGGLSSQVTACSHAVAKMLGRYIPASKLQVVYGAVEQSEAQVAGTLGDCRLRLLTLGRVHPSKGQEDSVRATMMLAASGLDLELSLVGGRRRSEYRARLARLAEASPARERISFHDFTDQPHAHLALCDIFLMTSRSEAFGRVTVEAMKAGRAVVAAASGGNVELIRDGWNGLLYRPGDSDDLARKIRVLYEDPSLRAQLARQGRDWACERFTLERYGADLVNVLTRATRSQRL
jgi:glycosyltransferase involved in cell wall biosynthesis